mmetsp:Transcript_29742/g.76378  ORF Transcript_29742/g.76378 Transcript_29742/m.76378 type:complete len:368 (-) Transcript_29742:88-1191(-)
MHLRDAAVEKVPDGALDVEVARRNLEVGDDVGEPVLLRAAEGDAHVAVLAVPQHPRLRVGVDVVHVADRLQPLDRAANQLRQRLPGVQHLHGRALHSLQRDVVQVSGCFAKGNKLQAEVDRAAAALAAQVQAELVLLAVHIRRHRQHRHAQRVVRPDHVLVRQAHQQLLGIRVPDHEVDGLVPLRVKVLVNHLCPAVALADAHTDVRVAGAPQIPSGQIRGAVNVELDDAGDLGRKVLTVDVGGDRVVHGGLLIHPLRHWLVVRLERRAAQHHRHLQVKRCFLLGRCGAAADGRPGAPGHRGRGRAAMPARLAPICPVARSRCQLRRAPPAAYNPCGASLAAVDTATSSSAPDRLDAIAARIRGKSP